MAKCYTISYGFTRSKEELIADVKKLCTENERLKEALKEIVNRGYIGASYIAQQALNEMETCPACGGSTYTDCMAANGGMTQIPCANCGGSGEVTK